MNTDDRYLQGLRRAGQGFAVIMLLLGLIGLAGWVFDQPLWRSLWRTGPEMKFNTAACNTLLGCSVLLAYGSVRVLRWIAFTGSILVLGVASLTLGEYASGRSFGIDELVFRDTNFVGTIFAGRMAAQSATTFVLLATANLLLAAPSRSARQWGQWCALGSLIFPAQALMGYLLGRMTIMGLGVQSGYMAIPTTLAFTSGAAALLLLQPTSHLMEALMARTQASMIFRRLLLASVTLPILLGWLVLNVAGGSAKPPEYSVATVALATSFLFVTLTWLHAAKVNRMSQSLGEREKLLGESEARYRTLFESIDQGFCVIQMLYRNGKAVDYRFLEMNPAFEKHTGLQGVIGKTIRELVPRHEEHWFEIYGRVVATGEPVRFQNEAREIHRWFDVYAFRFGEPQNQQVAVLFSDITLARRNQEELRDAKARLETTLAATEVATWIWDVQNDRVFADKNLARFFSLSPEAAAGGSIKSYVQAIHPDDRVRVQEAIGQAMRSEAGTYEVDYRIIQPDGSVRWVTARGKSERDAEGQPVRFPGVIIDITERKHGAERERQSALEAVEANAKFRAVFDQSAAFAGIMDLDGTLLEANRLSLDACGYQAGEAIGHEFWKTPWWRNSPVVQEKIQRATEQAAQGNPFHETLPYWWADGTERLVDFALYPIRDDQGRIIYLQPTGVDITERMKADTILRQNEGLFTALVDQAPTGVYVVDAQFRLQQINAPALPAFAQVEPKLGRDFGEVMNILWGLETGTALAAIFRHTLATGEPYVAPAFSGFREDLGEEKAYEWQTKRVTLPDGSHGVVCYFNDITERIRAEQGLLRAKSDAEAASRSKDQFLAALSHELRTPLNPALLIASESADNPDLPATVRANFETVRKNIELEARLIDDLLDLTRITTGKMVLHRRPTDVHLILRDALATIEADYQEKNIAVLVELAAATSTVEGDAVRLQQVFWNVLKNSVKFTPKDGKISVETRLLPENRLAIIIADTGIGMSEQEVARVFDAFAQGDHAGEGGSHRFGGLGLGLAISKNLIGLHAGRITAQSAGHDHGSVFTIELPLLADLPKPAAAGPETARKPGAEAPLPKPALLSILLVEDHEITRTILAQLLVRRNYHVVMADSLAQARERAASERFDVLISDVGLPDGNGNDLMDEFREQYGLKGIALTGYGMEDDIARGKAAGFVTHLIKPVSIKSLESALALFRPAE